MQFLDLEQRTLNRGIVQSVKTSHTSPFFDERHKKLGCVYCGLSFTENQVIQEFKTTGTPAQITEVENRRLTRDHVPSRVFLDEPYPSNLPVVDSCSECNQSFSSDEQYVACLLECIVSGGTNIQRFERKKIAQTLEKSKKLQRRLSQSRRVTKDGIAWEVEMGRLKNVVVKLAKGHCSFENVPQNYLPTTVSIKPLVALTPETRQQFESTGHPLAIFPEIGSRAFIRIFESDSTESGNSWIEVQQDRYRYAFSTLNDGTTIVKIVLRNYLACEVTLVEV